MVDDLCGSSVSGSPVFPRFSTISAAAGGAPSIRRKQTAIARAKGPRCRVSLGFISVDLLQKHSPLFGAAVGLKEGRCSRSGQVLTFRTPLQL